MLCHQSENEILPPDSMLGVCSRCCQPADYINVKRTCMTIISCMFKVHFAGPLNIEQLINVNHITTCQLQSSRNKLF